MGKNYPPLFGHILFNIILIVLAMVIREKIKESKLEKKVKLSLLIDAMMLCKVNPQDATRKLLESINEFGKVAG